MYFASMLRKVLVAVSVAALALLATATEVPCSGPHRHHHPRETFDDVCVPCGGDSVVDDRHPYKNNNRGLKPSVMKEFGRVHYYQLPPDPKGTVVVFPGCARGPQGFWPYDPETCAACYGFPEDVSNSKQILNKGYAILVLSPRDTKHLCWSGKVDFPDVAAILKRFLTQHSLLDKPLYTHGASSGGNMAMGLAGYAYSARLPWLRVSGVIQTVSTNALPWGRTGQLRSPDTPPVVFVVMSAQKEQRKAEGIATTLRNLHVPAAVAVSGKRPITDDYFSDRMPAVSPARSKLIAQALRDMGQIDADGNFLSDPKTSGWDVRLRKAAPFLAAPVGSYTLVFRRSGLWQSMTYAYSKHEHTSDYTTAALSWFESGPRRPRDQQEFQDIVAREKVDVPAALKLSFCCP